MITKMIYYQKGKSGFYGFMYSYIFKKLKSSNKNGVGISIYVKYVSAMNFRAVSI